MMKRIFVSIVIACLLSLSHSAFGDGKKYILMSTTTSTENSGLLAVILPHFTRDTGIEVRVLAKGTGAAIRDGMDGNVDVILVHDRKREESFVSEGYGAYRLSVMHNDFVLLGPPSDPAAIQATRDAVAAMKLIAGSKSPFVSRGDDSGTHSKEQELWRLTGIPLKRRSLEVSIMGVKRGISFESPEGEWYFSIGQGMGRTLLFADEKRAYTLSDRATFLKHKFGKGLGLDLKILCQGDERLFNYYGVIPVSFGKHKHVRFEWADSFAKWLVSPKGQSYIKDYKISGQQAFFPDAEPSKR